MKNSTTYNVFVGIDISKLTLDVMLESPDQSQTVFIRCDVVGVVLERGIRVLRNSSPEILK